MTLQPVAADDVAVNANVSRAVKILIAANAITQAELCLGIGMTRPTIVRRLNGTSDWTAAELARLAAYFGVSVTALMGGRDGVLLHTGNGGKGGSVDQYASFIGPGTGVSPGRLPTSRLIPRQKVAA